MSEPDGRSVIVELGAGDFSNIKRIVAEHPQARVIGVEHGEQKNALQLAEQSSGKYFPELLRGYQEALQAQAEIWFCDFTSELPGHFADQVIMISPGPIGQEGMTNRALTVRAICQSLKPGGGVLVITELESLGEYVLQALQSSLGREGEMKRVRRAEVGYRSNYWLGSEFVYVVEFL